MLPQPMKAMFAESIILFGLADGRSPHSVHSDAPELKRGRRHVLGPNSAVPIRTKVAPSAMAASRSAVVPIESVSNP